MHNTRLAIILCAAIAAPAAAIAEEEAATLIGTINGTPYSLDLFRLYYAERVQQNQDQDSPDLQEQAFNDFMSLVVTSQEGAKRGLEQDPEVTLTLELQRMKILANAVIAALAEELQPTDDELKTAYESVKDSASRTEYKARHILVESEEEAKALIAELDKGADFGELARKSSLGPTAKSGGELDWFDAGQMVAPFGAAVTTMEVGTYTKAPVQTQFGWHVIQLQDSRKSEPPSFEDAKAQLTAILQRDKISKKIAELRENALVDLNEEIVRVSPKEEATE
ncbi:MAG: peptidylprolyl isomerase [Sphingobacteriia bacterium]|nr:peptidylprolyl isomerase [Sphingobacteriia bacterium]NCC38133.1 peptidylprolyl isomerase [Gammaproteobacteria bacterium]